MNAAAHTLPADIRMMQRVTTWLWMVLVGLVAATALLLLARSPWFGLRAIVVEGDTSHHNPLSLRANVAPRLGGNFFSIDLQASRAVFESLPWVRRAVVKREFPNKLRVVLQEHQPIGTWGRASESQLINTEGEVFEANVGEVDAESLPVFVGSVDQSKTMLQAYRELGALFKPHDLLIDELELSGRGSWSLHLDSGTSIELGRGQLPELLERTRVFLSTVTQAAGQWGKRLQKDVESVDLRHSNGYAIKLRGIGTVQAKPAARS
jgi:cell division protein FtsQ